MLIDARDLPDGTVLDADLCVIGAGAAGITIARELSGSPVGVLLLESGGFELDARTQRLYRGEVTGLPVDPFVPLGLDTPRLRYFGGTTNHWAGYTRPLDEHDFEHRTWIPHSGWPFGRDELVPFYARAQDVVRVGPLHHDWRYWSDAGLLAPPLLDGTPLRHLVVQLTNEPRFAVRYRDALVGAPNVRLCLWSNVTGLSATPDGAAIEGAEVATLRGSRFRVRARAYVLATGGLEVPRLLLASSSVRPAGLGNEHDLVGRFFAEHLNVGVGAALLTAERAALQPYQAQERTLEVGGEPRTFWLQGQAAPAPEALRDRGLRDVDVTLAFGFAPDDPRVQRSFPATRDVAALMHAMGTPPRSATFLRALAEQAPNPRSRVTLAREHDELGMPRARLDWHVSHDDRSSILRSLRLLGEALGGRGLGLVQTDIAGFTDPGPGADDHLDFPLNSGSHHMGTARMHASPRHGVVDPQCRVHGVANLYVAGSAVFPTSGSAPPTLTIVALALRLADHLRDRVLR